MNSVLTLVFCALYFLAPIETYAKKCQKKQCIKIQECEPIVKRLRELVSTNSNELDSYRKEVEKLKCGTTENPNNFKVLCPVKRSNKQKIIKCGEMAQSRERVFDGSTRPDAYEWLVLLEYETPKGTEVLCSGVLISDRHVLTAASCLDKNYNVTGVRLREYDLEKKVDTYFGRPLHDSVEIADTKVHHKYKLVRQHFHRDVSDIAILRLARSVSAQPICLPTQDAESKGFHAVGWGLSPYSDIKKFPKKTLVQMIDTKCPELRNENILCVKPIVDESEYACASDVGGPLMQVEITKNRTNQPYVVSGIYAPDTLHHCIVKDFSYTDVFKHIDWIRENMD